MKIFLLISSFLMSSVLAAADYNATSFSCSSEQLILTFHIDINNNIDQFSCIDNNIFWYADNIINNNLTYTIKAKGKDSVIDNDDINLSMQLQFSLPEERKVTRRQTGGYYTPIYETYPFQFLLKVDYNNSLSTIYLNCLGY